MSVERAAAPYLVYAMAGFRRHATYRQAMFAAMFTNTVFGFIRAAVMLAVAGAGAVVGYDEARLMTFVWVGQGLIGVVLLWAPTELADRIRSGDVIADLLRPVHLVWPASSPPISAARRWPCSRGSSAPSRSALSSSTLYAAPPARDVPPLRGVGRARHRRAASAAGTSSTPPRTGCWTFADRRWPGRSCRPRSAGSTSRCGSCPPGSRSR